MLGKKWPTFFIGGAPRTGTTFLYEILNQSNEVFMSPIKEPNYFAPSINHKKILSRPISSENEYLHLFENITTEKAIGEASPTYLWDPLSPELIFNKLPNAKMIFILRNPIKRSFSHYLNGLGLGYENDSFINSMKNALQNKNDYSGRIAMASFYYDGLKRYYEIFDKKNIKILIFEKLFKDPNFYMKEICDFLGIKHFISNDLENRVNEFTLPRNRVLEKMIKNNYLREGVRKYFPIKYERFLRQILTKHNKKPKMTYEEENFAKEIFREDILKLEKLLGYSLPWN